mmetsp:Transcript_29501/g.71882  ORF Transcript_29501/g.71882 Transcript_29501/m.71882 type:complete len:762 (-) Transcript_29501:161-2446(-)
MRSSEKKTRAQSPASNRPDTPSSPYGQESAEATLISETTTEMTKILGSGGLKGGQLLEWMDITACMSAEKFSGMPSVTAAMDDVHMLHSPEPGDAIIVNAQVNRAFRTSMEVGCHVWAEALNTGARKGICRAYFTFVSLGPDGKKRPLPRLVPGVEPENVRRHAQALERRKLRLERRTVIEETFQAMLTSAKTAAHGSVEAEEAAEVEAAAGEDGKGKGSNERGLPLTPSAPSGSGNENHGGGSGGKNVSGPSPNLYQSLSEMSVMTAGGDAAELRQRHHRRSIVFISPTDVSKRKPKAAHLSYTESTEIVLPSHANHMGNCFGGQAMSWMVACARVSAHRFTREEIVLTSIDQISFKNPVLVADRFTVKAQVNHSFPDCVEVGARAECHSLGKPAKHALSAYFIFSTRNGRAVQYELDPITQADKRRHKEALGRKRVRLRRLQLGTEQKQQLPEYSEESKRNFIYVNISGLMRAYNRKLMKRSWTIHHRTKHIEIATQKSTDKVTVFRLCSKFTANPHRIFDVLYNFVEHRPRWDLVYHGGKVVEKIDEQDDIIHLVMKGASARPRDFCLLRSWRQTTPGVWLISMRSVRHPKVPPVPEFERSYIHSSGYILKVKSIRKEVKITFKPKSMGITLKDLRVYQVDKEGQAKKLGVRRGWEVFKVGDKEVEDQASLKEEIKGAIDSKREFSITFKRSSSPFWLSMGTKLSKSVRLPKDQRQTCELTYLVQFRDKAIELTMGDMVGYNRIVAQSFEKLQEYVTT